MTLAVLSFFAFRWSTMPNYDGVLDAVSAAEFQFKTSSDALKDQIRQFYHNDFDRIDRVDVHWGAEQSSFYYAVYGQKDQAIVHRLILVSDAMVAKQSFPTRAQMGISEEAMFIPCYWNRAPGTIFFKCTVEENRIECGVSPSGGLCLQTGGIPVLD